jgi:type II secretory ATPase GspE/PulE/Tfp pilus assembly ATPase PilB-like protein
LLGHKEIRMTTFLPTHHLSIDRLDQFDTQVDLKLVHMVLLIVLKDRATEMTFQPQPSEYRLLYTVEGTLYEMVPPPPHLAPAIIQVFKVLAELDIDRKPLAQAGGMRLVATGGSADVHLSIWQTPHGEAVRLTIESNSTSGEEIDRQWRELRKNRPRVVVPMSWLQRLWRLVRNLGRST